MKLHEPFGPPTGDVVWHVKAQRHSYIVDAEREEYGVTDPRLELIWARVERRTSKGFFVNGEFFGNNWKRCRWKLTREDALESFKRRREVQIDILERQLQRAREELNLLGENEKWLDLLR